MRTKNIIKIAPLFILITMFSTHSFSSPLEATIKALQKSKVITVLRCKDYPLCKELGTPESEKKKGNKNEK